MAIALEKRIRKLESRAGLGRCNNPDHASLFFIDPNYKAREEAKIESMRSCQKCSSRQALIFVSNVELDED
jgi:hypothetical protein